ncbi:MAG: urea ABC transporter ATP-binding subunit UrtE [Treponema sp.]|uniref:urea ABC transporter ATP-binding subunit UrtE n=1 Tax=Treponema sp. TaxID=166 RepID=UPI002A91AA47|nr:urea ABC transporter ATP-binding subunit UrtE [Treponema sp.]MDY6398925.1 urea ABC transporter ATP-binding subunit UrtE [Treponema sp.]
MLEIKNLSSYYGESRIIPSLSMSVPKGEIVCLVGRNGVGKSTTLKSIMGMVKTPEGSILLDGKEIIGKKTYERAALGIGYVPQGREIFPQLTVAENLELGLQVSGGKGEIGEEIFELFPIIKTFMNRKGGNLSGGQQQQLAIARALVSHPKLLILDEPTEGIQPSIIEDIASAIERVNKELGITILIVEQYLDFVLSVSNRYYVMDKGEITLSGFTKDADSQAIQAKMAIG